MKTKECHWDTAFVSCIGSPLNNWEPCGRARVLGRARDRERERERERVRWGLDWSQSNVRHHYQHQPTNHHHHQPITKILITINSSHETLASLKMRTVVYMEGLSCCYWLADRSLWLFFFILFGFYLVCYVCFFFNLQQCISTMCLWTAVCWLQVMFVIQCKWDGALLWFWTKKKSIDHPSL